MRDLMRSLLRVAQIMGCPGECRLQNPAVAVWSGCEAASGEIQAFPQRTQPCIRRTRGVVGAGVHDRGDDALLRDTVGEEHGRAGYRVACDVAGGFAEEGAKDRRVGGCDLRGCLQRQFDVEPMPDELIFGELHCFLEGLRSRVSLTGALGGPQRREERVEVAERRSSPIDGRRQRQPRRHDRRLRGRRRVRRSGELPLQQIDEFCGERFTLVAPDLMGRLLARCDRVIGSVDGRERGPEPSSRQHGEKQKEQQGKDHDDRLGGARSEECFGHRKQHHRNQHEPMSWSAPREHQPCQRHADQCR